MTNTLGLFQGIGPLEIGIVLVVALLIFGRRLPEVGRNFGKSIVEFKKGLKGIDNDIENTVTEKPDKLSHPQKKLETTINSMSYSLEHQKVDVKIDS